jgi:serine protease AprX
MVSYKRILLLIFLIPFGLFAQDGHYMVFFKDKANTPFTVDQPSAFLSERSLARRAKSGASVSLQDLPVNPAYVKSIKDLNVLTYYTSKWMNALLVEARQSDMTTIAALPFVDSISFVAPARNLNSARVEDVENTKFRLNLSSIGQLFSSQNIDNQLNMHGIKQMHENGFSGEGIIIGVFDDGFRGYADITSYNHLTQNNKILDTYDFAIHQTNVNVGFSHGVQVFSIIAANTPGLLVGAAPNADFVLFVTEDSRWETRLEEYNWLFAAERADSIGVDVINTSLGYSNGMTVSSMNYTTAQMDGKTSVISRAAEIAFSKGMFMVNSAGNYGNSSWGIIATPADASNVLAVGAVNSASSIAGFSSRGPNAGGQLKPDVSALGNGTFLLRNNGTRVTSTGTSFSSPVIAGFVANLWQEFPWLTNAQLLDVIRKSGDRFENPNIDYGYGIPDYERARSIIITSTDQVKDNGILLFPNPAFDRVTVSTGPIFRKNSNVEISIVDLQGKILNRESFFSENGSVIAELDISTLQKGFYLVNLSNGAKNLSLRLIRK